ncbi:MAG: amino acid adenylation domain-containing protein, partial [Legionellaceae bacterium]|nr:amino acid adenylation domain-containing protein [Legionellaceae bacterium]
LDDDLYHTESNQALGAHSGPEDLAYVIYTSGSTGKPKGVMVEHRSLCNLVCNQIDFLNLTTASVMLQYASLVFDASVFEIFTILNVGGCLCITPEFIRHDAVQLLDYLKAYKISVAFFTPSLLKVLSKDMLPDLNTLVIGGEASDVATVETWKNGRLLIDGYGPTEGTAFSTMYIYQENSLKPSIGKPLGNICTYVLDDALNPVPLGVTGELYIGGASLARGYLNQPEFTEERFISNPFLLDGSRIYKTGDLVRLLSDGNLEYLGRNDFQVKIRGFRIELGEIESVLLNFPGIIQSTLLMKTTKGSQYLVAYYVSNVVIAQQKLVEHLSFTLPEYMIPHAFVHLEAFPLTINGKLDRAALPEPDFNSEEVNYVAPRNALEQKICLLWAEVLKVRRVGIQDNFFRMGGHSILAIQLAHRMSNLLEKTFHVADIFKYKTILDLLGKVTVGSDCMEIEPTPDLVAPLSFAQERLWFIECYEQGADAYHIPFGFEMDASIDLCALKAALQAIVKRHAVLRTLFFQDEQGFYYQSIQDKPLLIKALSIQEVDLPEALYAASHTVFDLTQDYPIKAWLYTLNTNRNILMLNIHHIAFDGWSKDIFLKELTAYYQYGKDGKDVEEVLPSLAIQYKDFAVWQRNYLSEARLADYLAYWTEKLTGYEQTVLSTDYPRPPDLDYQGENYVFLLDQELSLKLRRLAQAQGYTLYTVLLTGFFILLAKHTRQKRVVLGSPMANRHYPSIDVLIGFFVNLAALEFSLDSEATVLDCLDQVHQQLIEVQEYQALPFDVLVNHLGEHRDSSRHPIFQILFDVVHTCSYEDYEQKIPSFRAMALEHYDTAAKYDLSIIIHDEGDDVLRGVINYATSLYRAESIKNICCSYQEILNQMVRCSDLKPCKFLLQTKNEYLKVVFDWNKTERSYPHTSTLHALFEAQVRKNPQHIALVYEEQTLSYQALDEEANRLARFIQKYYSKRQLTLGSDTLIALCVSRSFEMVIGILGILKAGAAYVPMDVSAPIERLHYMLEDAGSLLLLTERRLIDCQLFTAGLPLESIFLDDKPYQYEPCSSLSTCGQSTDLAYVIYTSGTTGKPKGVMIEHRGAINLVQAQHDIFNLSQKSILANYFSIAFDASVSEIFCALIFGCTLHIIREEIVRNPLDIVSYLAENKISAITLPPALLSMMDWNKLPDLQTIVVAGETCDQRTMERWGKDRLLINAYGPTESTVCSTTHVYEQGQLSTFIGRPIDNLKAYVLDEYGAVMPVGVTGELHVAGAGLARGYLNQPKLTEERFIPNVFASDSDKAKGYT